MIKPAQLYKEEIKKKYIETWYNEEYMYYSGWSGVEELDIPNNNYDSHHFVSVDNNGNILGYISYSVSFVTMSADRFGAISFDKGNVSFVAYIPSIGRGHNILKAIANDIGLPEYETYEELYKALEDEGTVRSIMENDKEIEFKFHARKLEYIALFLKPAIAGADISPFSTKNLPKCDYTIPEGDLAEYNAILDSMDNNT